MAYNSVADIMGVPSFV